MGIKKWIVGVATLAAMNGSLKAEQRPVETSSESIKTETVIKKEDVDYSQELKPLDEALKNSSDLQYDDLCEIHKWQSQIIDNPSDSISREAFKKIKAEALKVTNVFVMIDQYYNYEYLGDCNVDNFKRSQKRLHQIMDEMLSYDEVRNNIPEANIAPNGVDTAKDFAKMRFYEQEMTYEYLQKNPKRLAKYMEAAKSNKKSQQKIAKNIEMNFYKEFGIDISSDFATKEGNGNIRRYMEYQFLRDPKLKEKVYMFCLHCAMDGAFDYYPRVGNSFTIKGKTYTIPVNVAQSFLNYARIYAAKERGAKLSKEHEEILDNRPSDIRSATDAYLKRAFDQFCKLKDLPKGEHIRFIDTQGEENLVWSNYIKLSRKNELSPTDKRTMELTREQYPLLKKAEEYYKVHQLLSENKKQESNILLSQNTTNYRR